MHQDFVVSEHLSTIEAEVLVIAANLELQRAKVQGKLRERLKKIKLEPGLQEGEGQTSSHEFDSESACCYLANLPRYLQQRLKIAAEVSQLHSSEWSMPLCFSLHSSKFITRKDLLGRHL